MLIGVNLSENPFKISFPARGDWERDNEIPQGRGTAMFPTMDVMQVDKN